MTDKSEGSSSSQNRSTTAAGSPVADPDLETRVKKVTEKVSENIHIVANEPSLALYRLQEHVRKSLPVMIERKIEAGKLRQELQGRYFDVEYAVYAVKSMHGSCAHFQSIQELLKNSIFLKQQLAYEENRKHDRKTKSSMYQRLSSLSIDLNELPDALRPLATVLTNSGVMVDKSTQQAANRKSN